jgi:hypothetical protein
MVPTALLRAGPDPHTTQDDVLPNLLASNTQTDPTSLRISGSKKHPRNVPRDEIRPVVFSPSLLSRKLAFEMEFLHDGPCAMGYCKPCPRGVRSFRAARTLPCQLEVGTVCCCALTGVTFPQPGLSVQRMSIQYGLFCLSMSVGCYDDSSVGRWRWRARMSKLYNNKRRDHVISPRVALSNLSPRLPSINC